MKTRRPPNARSRHLSQLAFVVLLALALLALFMARPVSISGDALEYTVDAVAIATHGTPEIRSSDIDRTMAILPGRFDGLFRMLQDEMRRGVQDVYPAFARGRGGEVYPVHFFGYPLMAALPLRLLEALGQPPFKAFQAVNLAFVFVLGLALRRFFASSARAAFGLLLFMLCCGVLYWTWTSPECASAAALLAALLLFTSGMPVAGALLAGLAAQQNPTIVFFFVFAPLIRMALGWDRSRGLTGNLRAQVTLRTMAALAAGAAVAALPILFNLYHYGVPNLIVARFSDPGLIGSTRLLSFFADLNQGMVIGIPGVLAALLLVGARGLRLLALCLLFTLALVLPALAVINWNSGAAGPMRYVAWASMPLLFTLLAMLRELPTWRPAALAGVLALQAAAMVHATRYEYIEFSPLAALVLKHAPAWYHPEPEIFVERMGHNDNWVEPEKIYTYQVDGVRIKTLVHASNAGLDAALCRAGARLAPGNAVTVSARGWRYLDGPLRCTPAGPQGAMGSSTATSTEASTALPTGSTP
ncbi:hypothetical protein [Telluria aromaticivorans]|uniref:Glycosyltransferase RgtA/B/C/D-like domain-containing protein n=1 Tax=Telluria aromaticivorans TaxID=2725995 RepID=A0A7Y2NZX2_9BURK|nr:hypothetical protein [Telluria aromaticivorans]NNG22946.1 hypothetical protein [Telluria aromaticivorans]